VPRVILSKNVGFIQNLVSGKLAFNDTGVLRIAGKTVWFHDGSSKEFDCIICCTGFKKNFASLGTDILVEGNNVRNLYKHCFHPKYHGRLAFIGFVRPFSGGIPIVAEMQSRYFAQLCSKKMQLPFNLDDRILKEKKWEDRMTQFSPKRTESIPSQILLLDSMATEIGCLPPWYKLLLRPVLAYRLYFFPLNPACYRLVGPHSSPDAQNVLFKDVYFPRYTSPLLVFPFLRFFRKQRSMEERMSSQKSF
jgi:dimethylaniline monooxygenase (N-oxide forming)